jgi:hypothetical protein
MKKYAIILLGLVTLILPLKSQTLTVGNNQTVIISADTTYTSLVMGNNAKLTVNAGIVLTINGDVDANNGGDFYINGTLVVTGAFVADNNINFFITGSLDVGSITVKNNGILSVSGSGDVNVSGNFNAEHGTSIFIDIGGDMGIGGNATIGNNANINVDGTLDVGGNFYVGSGNINIGDEGSITVGGTFGGGATITGGGTLPVTLIISNIYISNSTITLSWSTATEINNDRFEILRSNDMRNWNYVGTIAGSGNSQSMINYTFSDYNAPVGQLYYQIKQIDYDGTNEIIAQHAIFNREAREVSLYPNPVTEGQQWFLKGIGENDKIQIFNTAMQPTDKEKLVKGIYFIIVNQNAPMKLVVQ